MIHRPRVSGRARAVILGGAVFGLAACEEKTDLTYFENAEQCTRYAGAEAGFSVEDCQAAFAEAAQSYALSAPRYESRELCEEEHGPAACAPPEVQAAALGLPPEAVPVEHTPEQASQGGSIFMPLMAGYMMGSMMSGGARAASQPVYTGSRGAGLVTGSGKAMGAVTPGSTRSFSGSELRAPKAAPQVLSRANVASRGGFGASRTSGGLRSLGG